MNKIKNLVMLCATLGVLGSPPALAEVVVGVSVSTTGPGASLGIPEKNAVALFPTTIAGETVRYVVLDDGSDPSTATKNARKFVSEEKADVLVGSAVTPASAAIAQVAFETGTPHIALSPVTLPADRGHWVFRTPQHNSVMAGALVGHMQSAGVKTLGFIGFADAYGDEWLAALEPLLQKAGIKIVQAERFARNDTSVTGQVLKLVGAKPDAIIVVGSGSPAALPQTTLVERGYKGQVYQTHAVANQAFLSVAGKAAEGMILPVGPVVVVDQIPADHPSKEIGSAFVRRYEEKYGAGTFSSFAGHAHDAFRLLEAAVPVALKTAAPGTAEFRLALRDALETNKEVVGAHGVYNMSAEDHFGLDTRGRVLVRIENGGYSMIGQ